MAGHRHFSRLEEHLVLCLLILVGSSLCTHIETPILGNDLEAEAAMTQEYLETNPSLISLLAAMAAIPDRDTRLSSPYFRRYTRSFSPADETLQQLLASKFSKKSRFSGNVRLT